MCTARVNQNRIKSKSDHRAVCKYLMKRKLFTQTNACVAVNKHFKLYFSMAFCYSLHGFSSFACPFSIWNGENSTNKHSFIWVNQMQTVYRFYHVCWKELIL